jgi:hypothetical protein
MQKPWLFFPLPLAVLLFTFGCKSSQTQSTSPEMLTVEFTIAPAQFSISDIDKVKVQILAENQGKRTVQPRLAETRVFVNGEESMSWTLTIGNGRRSDDWFDLPPGKSVSMSWSTLAASLFTEPGNYSVQLLRKDKVLSESNVEITE